MSSKLKVVACTLGLSVAIAIGGSAEANTYMFDSTVLQPSTSAGPTLTIQGSFSFEPDFARQAAVLTADFDVPEAVDFQIFQSGSLIRHFTDPGYFIYTDGTSNAGLGYIFGLAPNGNLDALGDQLYISYVTGSTPSTEILFGANAFSGGFLGNPVFRITAVEPSSSVPEPASLALLGGPLVAIGMSRRHRKA